MAITPKSFASWGLITDDAGDGGETQLIEGIEVQVETEGLLSVSLEASEITVEIDDA